MRNEYRVTWKLYQSWLVEREFLFARKQYNALAKMYGQNVK